jgi:hypothetical protein
MLLPLYMLEEPGRTYDVTPSKMRVLEYQVKTITHSGSNIFN